MDVYHYRQQKDSFLKQDPASPLFQTHFEALTYFPVTVKYSFRPMLKRLAEPEQLELQTSTGDAQFFYRLGHLQFELEHKFFKLSVFALSLEAKQLFLPFKDKTNGFETYVAGRYLDLELKAGRVRLDFNYAYSPYCAYAEGYRCPLPPPENNLTVAIRAGEKLLQKGVIHAD